MGWDCGFCGFLGLQHRAGQNIIEYLLKILLICLISQIHYKRHMFTIKIAYKGKNILLPKGIDSTGKIESELISRFPGEFPYGAALSYQGNPIADFAQIEAIAVGTGAKSLKIEAEPAVQKVLSVIEEEKKSESTEKTEVKQVEIKEEVKQIQQKQEHKQPEVNVEVEEPKVQQKVEAKIEPEPTKEINKAVEIDIDSMSSEADPMEVEHVENNDKVEVPIETEHQPEIIKCAIFGEGPKEEQDPAVIKCTIYNQEPKVEEPVQPELQKVDYVPVEVPKVVVSPKEEQKEEEIPKYQSEIRLEKPIKDELELKEIAPGVYECIFCRPFELCNICETKRQINEKSKLIMLINNIVDKRLTQKFEEFEAKLVQKLGNISNKEKVESKKQEEVKQQKKIKRQESSLDAEIEKQILAIRTAFIEIYDVAQNKKQATVGEQVYWTFHLKIRIEMLYRHKVCLIEERSGQLVNVEFTNNMKVKVGPFKAEHEGKLEKTYRLCFEKDDSSIQLFGPKFGFSIMVTKPKIKKMLTNDFRKHLETLKNAYKVHKPTEYLVEKLKELDITEQNYEQNKGIIPDIISTL